MRFFKVTVETVQSDEEEVWESGFVVSDDDDGVRTVGFTAGGGRKRAGARGSARKGARVWENSGRFARQEGELPMLYEELGRRAIVRFMEEDHVMGNGGTPYLGVVLMDPRCTEGDVREEALKAIECWGFYLPPRSSLRVTEGLATEVIGPYHSWGHTVGSPVYDTGLYLLETLRRGRKGFYGERILAAPPSPRDIRRRLERTGFKESLGTEIRRISQTAQDPANPETGLPYIISGSTNQERREALSLLLSSLQSANRLLADHVFEFDVDRVYDWINGDGSRFEDCNLDVLGEAVRGNTVVLSYGLHDNGDTYDKGYYDVFVSILDTLRPHLSSIQLVVVIPSQSKELEGRVRRLVGLPCVTVAADGAPTSLTFEGCWEYLGRKAQDEALTTDEALAQLLRDRLEDKSFSDLDGLFDEWRTRNLVALKLPAYLPEVEARYDRAPDPDDAPLSASQRLEELIGLGEVKEMIRNQVARCSVSREAAAAGLPAVTVSYHMAFEGNPGTGKTEVARLYGEILKDQGLLREGRVISTTGGSFSEKLCEKAVGGVLFIDEAYDLHPGYIAPLIAFMENHRDDTVVILAGYTASIEHLLDLNLGFRSRLGATVHFPDYTPEEMQEIFRLMARRAKLELTDEADAQMCEAFVRRGRKASQGNGRFARKLFEDVLTAQQVRLARTRPEDGYDLAMLKTIELDDVLEAGKGDEDQKPALERLEELVGLTAAKEQVRAFLMEARLQRVLRERKATVTPISLHMAFLGNPGTGKTEVARLAAEVLGEAGLLCEGGLVEITGFMLLADKRGSTPYFEEARGNVLFIDEAYALAADPCKVADLISNMENYRDDVVVIIAGYSFEITQLLESNPGFDSRIKVRVAFPDYTTDELVQILELQAKRAGFTLAPGVTQKVRPFFDRARREENFGNGRMVRNCLEAARTRQATRLMDSGSGSSDGDELTRLELEDFIDPSEVTDPTERRSAGF